MNRRQARKHGAKEEREVKRQVKQLRALKLGATPNSRRRQWWKAWHKRWIVEGKKEWDWRFLQGEFEGSWNDECLD